MDSAAATVTVSAAAAGLLGGGVLVSRGLRELGVRTGERGAWVGRASCALGGVAAVLGAQHASWWLLGPLLAWSYGLTAAAACDALTQRVPTPLARRASAVTASLVLVAAAVTEHWQWAVHAAIATTGASVIFWLCWRFIGAGFGDVRLAGLGGLGLVHLTRTALVAGIGTFIVVTVAQAALVLARGGTRHTLFPYGPGIAAGFLAAAIT